MIKIRIKFNYFCILTLLLMMGKARRFILLNNFDFNFNLFFKISKIYKIAFIIFIIISIISMQEIRSIYHGSFSLNENMFHKFT